MPEPILSSNKISTPKLVRVEIVSICIGDLESLESFDFKADIIT
jgi:hypothetical protein